MVRPPKLHDFKPSIIRQLHPKAKLKSEPSTKQSIDDRYQTEQPVHKLISEKTKPSNISKSKKPPHDLLKKIPQSPKQKYPAAFKISKSLSDSNSPKALIENKPAIKPVSTSGKTHLKQRNKSAAKPAIPVQAKSEPNNRFIHVRNAGKYDETSLPLGDSFIKTLVKKKIHSKMVKTGGIRITELLEGGRENTGKNNWKIQGNLFQKGKENVFQKEPSNVRSVPLKKKRIDIDISGNIPAKTHSKNPDPELNTTKKNIMQKDLSNARSFQLKKKRRVLNNKRLLKKETIAGDETKDDKSKTKPRFVKLKAVKPMTRNSISDFSVREIKHNDSFVISARKLQTATGDRASLKPEFIKLFKRTTKAQPKSTTGPNHLKSCMKKI